MINHIEDTGTISTENQRWDFEGGAGQSRMVAVRETGWHLLSCSTCTCLAFPHCSCQHHHHHLHHHHHDHHQVAAAPPVSAAIHTCLAVPHRGWHHQHGYQQHQYRQQANSLVLLPYCIDEFISNLLCLSFSCIVDLPGHTEYHIPIKNKICS